MTSYFESKTWRVLSALVCVVTFSLGLVTSVSAQEAPGVSVRATDPSSLTGTSAGAVTLIRHGDPNVPLTVSLSFGGTAVNGTDYSAIPATVSLDPGVLAYDVVVQGLVNTSNRGNKTVVVTVQTNAGYQVYGRGSATVNIVDDVFNVPPPSVTLTSPGESNVFTFLASITLTADASDSEIPVQSVSFYANDTFLGSVTNAPYTLVWNAPRAGNYALFARAVDQVGKSGVSTPVNITVSSTPVVTISSYFGDDVWIDVDDQLTAQIADPNEAIASATFYVDGKLLGTVTSAPFTIDWTPTVVGNHTIKVTVVDANTGKKATTTLVIYAAGETVS